MTSSKPSQYIKGWVEFYKQSLKNSTKDMPTAYKKRYVEFYKLKFKVTPEVLIPRPETELLIDEVLQFLSQLPTTNYQLQTPTILDLGTGSGNIAISIAKNLNLHPKGVNVKIIATDISGEALKVAKSNAKLHGVKGQITFLKSNLLDSFHYDTRVYHSNIKPDVIVTNLPYIPSERIAYLDSSVKDFEPHIALDGGENGFELYRKLFQQIAKFSLPPQGWKPKLIVGEVDYTHGELAVSVAQKYFPKAEVEVKTDLAHKQRILLIRQLL